MPLWVIGVATILVCALLAQRGALNAARQKAVGRILAGIVLPFILACISCSLLRNHFANRRLRSFAAGQVDSLIIRSGSKHVELREPAAIGDLFSLVCRGRKVCAHHSHPVDKIELFLPGTGYTYSLGRDSKVKDEFWLDWVSYPGSDPGIDTISTVRHFRSSELSGWLKEHVGSAEDGPAPGSQPIRSETNRAVSPAAVSLRLKLLTPLLVNASIAVACATVAASVAVILVAPLPTAS